MWGALEPVKAISAIAHHLAGFGDIAQAFRQFQHAHFGLDDLLFRRHGPHSSGDGEDSTKLSDEVLAYAIPKCQPPGHGPN